MFVCFVDYEKGFNSVRWKKLIDALLEIGTDWKDIRLILALYQGQSTLIKLSVGNTDPMELGRRVSQDCLHSPILFIIYTQTMMNDVLKEIRNGVKEQR